MKEEIEEILFLLHNDRLSESGKIKLEDHITNLQDYKTRIEKAIERLKFALKCKDSELQCVFEAYEIEKMIRDLQGKSDE